MIMMMEPTAGLTYSDRIFQNHSLYERVSVVYVCCVVLLLHGYKAEDIQPPTQACVKCFCSFHVEQQVATQSAINDPLYLQVY